MSESIFHWDLGFIIVVVSERPRTFLILVIVSGIWEMFGMLAKVRKRWHSRWRRWKVRLGRRVFHVKHW